MQTLTIERLRNWTPTQEQKNAYENALVAEAWLATVKPIVEEYKNKYFSESVILSDNAHGEIQITSARDSYLMTDADFEDFSLYCKAERKKNKLHVDNEDFCPLLVAEHNLNVAHKRLVKSFKPLSGISWADITAKLDRAEGYLTLLKKMMGKKYPVSKNLTKYVRVEINSLDYVI